MDRIKDSSKEKQSSRFSPQTLRLQLQVREFAQKEKRKHWDLYRHLCNPFVLLDALEQVKRNNGAAGTDGVPVSSVKDHEWEFVKTLANKLKTKAYYPKPVRRVYIPKANGKLRPLGIPALEDRVVQTALVIVLEPIYESIFLNCSYGFRPKRRAIDCAADVANATFRLRHVLDADIEGFFDNVQHRKLMGMVKEKVVDQRILDLIWKILKAGFKENDGPLQPTELGTPQGGPLSPLLANIYLHYALDEKFVALKSQKLKLFRYADDFIVVGKTKGDINFAKQLITGWLDEAKLKLSHAKTRLVNMQNRYRSHESKFVFLGFKFHLRAFKDNPKRFWIARQPSEKARQKLNSKLKEKLQPNINHDEAADRVYSVWSGWCEYFRYSNANRVFYRQIKSVKRQVFFYYLRRKYRRQRRPVPWRKLKPIARYILKDIKPFKVIPDLVRLRNIQLQML
jgi:group II intron reverse transcriptase/maturase